MPNAVAAKRRGRPATGREPIVTIRLSEGLIAALAKEVAQTGRSRSALIREYVEEGLCRVGGEPPGTASAQPASTNPLPSYGARGPAVSDV